MVRISLSIRVVDTPLVSTIRDTFFSSYLLVFDCKAKIPEIVIQKIKWDNI